MDALCECEELRFQSPVESINRMMELAGGFSWISNTAPLQVVWDVWMAGFAKVEHQVAEK
ncbi:hypothetical protein DVH05_000907 [Phytophthora capsici]|nr:hypothetical protein DVH05_000907 [Phytophthora capsici]